MDQWQSGRIDLARQEFFAKGNLPVDTVDKTILKSWIRSTELGLDASAPRPLHVPTALEVRALREQNEDLRRISFPEIDTLFAEVREVEGYVVLTNARGDVLDAVGHPGFFERAAEIALVPGVNWTETLAGTNAIGTAIADRQVVCVDGGEHFLSRLRAVSCAAAPIFDPKGQLLGIIDITTPVHRYSRALLSLARMATEQIEHRQFRQGFAGCRTFRFQADPQLLGASREGILVMSGDTIVAANRKGLSLIDKTWSAIGHLKFSEALSPIGGTESHWAFVEYFGTSGRRFYGRFDTNDHQSKGLSLPSLEDVELTTMRNALAMHNGNMSAAARALGINRSTLYRRLHEPSR